LGWVECIIKRVVCQEEKNHKIGVLSQAILGRPEEDGYPIRSFGDFVPIEISEEIWKSTSREGGNR
jgi:hypothetical protein